MSPIPDAARGIIYFLMDYAVSKATNTKQDGKLEAAEVKKYCSLAKPLVESGFGDSEELDAIDRRIRDEFCDEQGNNKKVAETKKQFPATYWTGVYNKSGEKVIPEDTGIISEMIRIDMVYGNKDGMTTYDEILEYRWKELSGLFCIVKFYQREDGSLAPVVTCRIIPDSPAGEAFDKSLESFSRPLFEEVQTGLEERSRVQGTDETMPPPPKEPDHDEIIPEKKIPPVPMPKIMPRPGKDGPEVEA